MYNESGDFMKIKQPIIKNIEPKDVFNDFISSEYISFIDSIHIEDIKMNECIFKNCRLIHSQILLSDLMDIIFENCDLSNLDFSKSIFHRVIFRNCRMTGIDFTDCTLVDCQFISSKCNLSNFSGSNMKNNIFNECDFSSSRFVNTKFKDIQLNHINFNESEFIHTPLNKIDFSNSEIYGISITPENLKGIIVNQYQALSLSKLLGIIVKE